MATENEVNKLCLAWTTDIEAELIEEIRKKEYLWDHRHPLYAKKSLKACGYLEIKEILTQRYPFQSSLFSTPNLINKKFNNLKEYYKKEVKRLKSFKSGDSSLDFQPKWKHFKRLEFLSDVIAADTSTSNLDPVADGTESVTDADKTTEDDNDSFLEIDVSVCQPKEEELENDQQNNRDSNTSNSTSTSGALSITKKRKLENSYKGKNNTAGSDIISEANEIMQKINVKEDGEDGFGRYIADYMRRLPYQIREKARINMLTALYSTVYEESE